MEAQVKAKKKLVKANWKHHIHLLRRDSVVFVRKLDRYGNENGMRPATMIKFKPHIGKVIVRINGKPVNLFAKDDVFVINERG